RRDTAGAAGAGGWPPAATRQWHTRRAPAPDPALAWRVVTAAREHRGRGADGCSAAGAGAVRVVPGPGRVLRTWRGDLGTASVGATAGAGGTAWRTGRRACRAAPEAAARPAVRPACDLAPPRHTPLPHPSGAGGGVGGAGLRTAVQPELGRGHGLRHPRALAAGGRRLIRPLRASAAQVPLPAAAGKPGPGCVPAVSRRCVAA